MLPYHTTIALDLAKDRSREARAAAEHHRLVAIARAEGRLARGARFARTRVAAAGMLRGLSRWADAIASAACSAASRVEGRTA